MPFLCICLILLGGSDDISAFLQKHSSDLREYAPATITIGLIAVFMVMFQFFNMFVGSVFWYLFNDVVPPQFLGRFIGTFRIIGTGAGALYNYFIFKFADTHMREIFIGAAVLYFIGFAMMCLLVREGEYPPLEGEADRDNKGWGGLRTFFKESFTDKFYWLRFLHTAFAATAGAIGVFSVFFNREMGLTLEQIGKISAISSVAMMAATYFMAIFIDRWHPLRICVYGAVFGAVGYFMYFVWFFVTLPGEYFFWLNLGSILVATFLAAVVGVAGLPCEMRIFPQSRFGQFCSAQALLRSLFTTVAGMAAGLFIDFFKWVFNGSDFAYRFIYLWIAFFNIIAAVFMILLYIHWYRMGGDKHFHPPASWNPKGFEEMPPVPTVGPQSKWLKMAFLLFDAVMGLTALSLPVLMLLMYGKEQFFALKWFTLTVFPLSVAAWVLWVTLKRKIKKDMLAAKSNLPLRNGIPHHGMLIIVGSKFLLAGAVWICQVFVTISMNMEGGAIAFGIANVITNFLLIGAVYLICRIERGYSVAIDEKPELSQ